MGPKTTLVDGMYTHTKRIAKYMAITLMTFPRLRSCQNMEYTVAQLFHFTKKSCKFIVIEAPETLMCPNNIQIAIII